MPIISELKQALLQQVVFHKNGIKSLRTDEPQRKEYLKAANKMLGDCGNDIEKFTTTLTNLQDLTGFDDEKLVRKLIKSCQSLDPNLDPNKFKSKSGSGFNLQEIARYLIHPTEKNKFGAVVNELLNRGKEIPKEIKKSKRSADELNAFFTADDPMNRLIASGKITEEEKRHLQQELDALGSDNQRYNPEDLKLLAELDGLCEEETPSTSAGNIGGSRMGSQTISSKSTRR